MSIIQNCCQPLLISPAPPGRNALIGPARIYRRKRGRSDSARCWLEKGEMEGREGEGWEVRRGRRRRWGRRGHRGEEVEETAAGPIG